MQEYTEAKKLKRKEKIFSVFHLQKEKKTIEKSERKGKCSE